MPDITLQIYLTTSVFKRNALFIFEKEKVLFVLFIDFQIIKFNNYAVYRLSISKFLCHFPNMETLHKAEKH